MATFEEKQEGIRKNVWLNKQHLDWVKENYPGVTLTWLLNSLLESYIRAHDSNKPKLNSVINDAGEILKASIDD